jgi:multiple sugar transport system permease protein
MNESTKQNGFNWKELLLQIPLLFFALLALFPFIWMVLSSFKTTQEIVQIPPTIFPERFTVRGYAEILEKLPITRNFLNSLIISSVATLIAMFVASLAGFVLAKYEFRGRNFFFYGVTVLLFDLFRLLHWQTQPVSNIGGNMLLTHR